jgi:hypothetical protein
MHPIIEIVATERAEPSVRSEFGRFRGNCVGRGTAARTALTAFGKAFSRTS